MITEPLTDLEEELTDDEINHATVVCRNCLSQGKAPRIGSIVDTLCGQLARWVVTVNKCPQCVALYERRGLPCCVCGK